MKKIILAEREKYTERDSDIVFMLYAGGQIFCICDYEENNHKIEYKKFSSFNEAWNYFSAECEDRDFPKRPQDKSGERMTKALELYEKYTAED